RAVPADGVHDQRAGLHGRGAGAAGAATQSTALTAPPGTAQAIILVAGEGIRPHRRPARCAGASHPTRTPKRILTMNVSLRRAAVTCAVSVLAVLPVASSASGATHHPQQRQLAETTLSSFKVVLTATREPGPEPGQELNATVTAAGYRHTPGW